MKTRFNLATSPLENNRRFVAGSCVLGVLTLVALVLLSINAYRARRSNAEIRAQITQVDSQIHTLESEQANLRAVLHSPSATAEMARSVYLNGLIEQRAFPWTKIFSDLEHILPPGVRVFSIAPQRDKQGNVTVGLVAGAASDGGKLQFIRSLESSPEFSQVQPVEETRPSKEQASLGSAVLFSIEARYATSDDPPAPQPHSSVHK